MSVAALPIQVPEYKHDLTISDLLYKLRKRCFGYATIIRQLRQVPTDSIDTMAVSIHEGRIALLYNPDWFRTVCDEDQALWVCRHEVMHISLDHIVRYMRFLKNEPELAKYASTKVANWAMDLSANSMVYYDKTLPPPEGVLFPETLQLPGLRLGGGWTFEQYLYALIDWVKEQPPQDGRGDGECEGEGTEGGECTGRGEGEGEGEGDGEGEGAGEGAGEGEGEGTGEGEGQGQGRGDPVSDGGLPNAPEHDFVKKINEMSQEERDALERAIKRQCERIMKKAAEECRDDPRARSRGSIPGELQVLFDEILKPKKLPWDEIFRNMIQNSINEVLERNMARPSRRRGHMDNVCPFPGKRVEPKFRIAFCVDTSGSMSDHDILKGMGVITDIMDSSPDIQCTVVQFDAAVLDVYDLGEAQKHPILRVYGRGGTSFDPPLAWVKERASQYDLAVYYTDGFAPEPREENIAAQMPMIWLLTPHHDKPLDGARGLYLTLDEPV